MDYWYIKGASSPKVYIYNPLTGTKRHLSAEEGRLMNAFGDASYKAKKTLAQAIVDAITEVD